jgi:LPS-assembly protein
MQRFAALTILTLFLLASLAGMTRAESTSPAEAAPFSTDSTDTGPWRLQADRLEVFRDKNIVEATGNVLVYRGNNTLRADFARYFWDINWIYLKGGIQASWTKDSLKAEEAELDLKNNVGWLKNATVFLHEPHLYFSGQELTKTGPSTYEFEQAEVTACDGETPSWSFRTSEGDITVEGYAHLKHPRFRIKDFPILYSPYLLLPVKRKRQSGFLFPEFSVGTEFGTQLNLPYYLVLGQEQDMTFYANAMSKRGLMLGAEYRFTPDLETKGVVQGDWLKDQETADTEAEEADQFDDDGLTRGNSQRYWLRGKIDGYLFTPAWKTKLDLDVVSDQNYLREFESGYNGFENSRSVFLEEFGRDINDKDELLRENVWLLSRNWASWGLQSRVVFNQNAKVPTENLSFSEDPTLQRLPEVNLNIYEQDVPWLTFLDWGAENEATYFWRHLGDTWIRSDFNPRINLPLVTAYGSLTPEFAWRETIYSLVSEEEEGTVQDSFRSRSLWEFNLNSFTKVQRIFDLPFNDDLTHEQANLGTSRWTKIKHSLRPEVEYTYIPERDQSDLPSFDSVDRIGQANTITYSLTSLLTRRMDTIIQKPSENGDGGYGREKDYLDFFRLKLEQSYDFNEADRNENLDTFPRRPFTDLKCEYTLRPADWLFLDGTTWYSPYENLITEHEHMLRLNLLGRLRTYFGLDFQEELNEDIHRQDQEELSILRTGGELDITDRISVNVDYEEDLTDSSLIEQIIGLTLKHQCWKIGLAFKRTEDEKELAVTVSLLGLGQVEEELGLEFF